MTLYAQTLILVSLIVVNLGIFDNNFVFTFLGCPVERFGRTLEEIKPKRSRTSLSTPEPKIQAIKPSFLAQKLSRKNRQNKQTIHDHYILSVKPF